MRQELQDTGNPLLASFNGDFGQEPSVVDLPNAIKAVTDSHSRRPVPMIFEWNGQWFCYGHIPFEDLAAAEERGSALWEHVREGAGMETLGSTIRLRDQNRNFYEGELPIQRCRTLNHSGITADRWGNVVPEHEHVLLYRTEALSDLVPRDDKIELFLITGELLCGLARSAYPGVYFDQNGALIANGSLVQRSNRRERALLENTTIHDGEFGIRERVYIEGVSKEGAIRTSISEGMEVSVLEPGQTLWAIDAILKRSEFEGVSVSRLVTVHSHPIAGFLFLNENKEGSLRGAWNTLSGMTFNSSGGDGHNARNHSLLFPELEMEVRAVAPYGITYSAVYKNGVQIIPEKPIFSLESAYKCG